MRIWNVLIPVVFGFCSVAQAQKSEGPSPQELKPIQLKLISQQQAIERQARDIKSLKRQLEDLQSKLQAGTTRLDHKIQEVGSTADTSTQRIGTLESRIGIRTLLILAGITVVGFGAILMFYVLRRKGEGFDKRLKEAQFALDQEAVKIDGKLVELLTNQMRLQDKLAPSSISATSNNAKMDHAFAMRVGEEIHRMRQRLASLPEDTKGLKPLLKSLERLEEDFQRQGYELVELLNKPYTEEMTVKARFIPSDDLNVGEKIITRVIKPLILFQGVMLEMPEIEVSTGG